ncbi:hypothetical protein QAD02_001753 [Eretmocerus hayati]|uniref:Uncharacterized protein n=1 Tax=Eretmocerus hayati TaxID=131215 RepID=A0ACC2NGX3_9HYME|nr:hypothetical protein QAD02_001753 [Eretmocerus hayati]
MTSVTACKLASGNCTRSGLPFGEDEPWLHLFSDYIEYQPWFFSFLGSAMVGMAGVLPLLVIPIDEAADLNHGDSAKFLKVLLSFAVGGLLGDVFIHILPEAWANQVTEKRGNVNNVNHATMNCGLWVLCGFLVFVIAEKIFCGYNDAEDDGIEIKPKNDSHDKVSLREHENNNSTDLDKCTKKLQNGCANGNVKGINGLPNHCEQNGIKKQPYSLRSNGYTNGITITNGLNQKLNGFSSSQGSSIAHEQQVRDIQETRDRIVKKPNKKRISGYLNLMANCVDNFTHGLAVGGSFLISFRLGALTTFAILIHEIPHEIGDFAILLKSGFTRWDAAKAQLMTASGGLCGAFAAVLFSGDDVESKTSWILPFTAGGFLHIGLVTVLPELLKETNFRESVKQMGALLTGIVIMAVLTILCD